MNKNLTITSFLGLLAIILGAFGAHALKNILSLEELQSFSTAIKYQMYHVIVLLFVNTFKGFSNKTRKIISYLFFGGIICFSGSIYAIYLLAIPAKTIWFITPFGGLLFVGGWLLMFFKFLKKSY